VQAADIDLSRLRLSPVEQAVLTILRDNMPHRRGQLLTATGAAAPTVSHALDALISLGLAQRFRHGVYGSMEAKEEEARALPPRMNSTTQHSTFGRVVGLIERVATEGKQQGGYVLTRAGTYLASLIDQYIAPRDQGELRELIAQRMEQKAARLRGVGHESSMTRSFRSILEVVVARGQITTSLIPDQMAVKFENPHSIHLAVKTMEERGYLRRAGKQSRSVVWEATEKGRAEIIKDG
jgi:DNA-binding MarR family transcriptional regulator